MRRGIMRRVCGGRMDLVAADLKHGVIGCAIGVKRGRIEFIALDLIEGLGIGATVLHLIYMTFVDRHDGLGGMDAAGVAVM